MTISPSGHIYFTRLKNPILSCGLVPNVLRNNLKIIIVYRFEARDPHVFSGGDHLAVGGDRPDRREIFPLEHSCRAPDDYQQPVHQDLLFLSIVSKY